LVEHVAYAQHHVASPGQTDGTVRYNASKEGCSVLKFSKRKRSIETIEHEIIRVGKFGQKGGVDVQAKNLATVGRFGRGKFNNGIG
jgi:hypothetical protein